VAAPVRLYRDGLADLLRRDERLEVVGTAGECGDVIAKIVLLKPDVVVVDTALQGSLATIRAITARQDHVRVVAIAVPDSDADVIACAEAGAVGYVTRDASAAELTTVVQSAAGGETVCSPRIAAVLFQRVAALAAERAPQPVLARLTLREREIALLVEEGLSNKQIARRLQIEVPTVKNHVHHILEKLHVRRRVEAAARLRADTSL
jgi:DNA-binding NarL/FixJ family response regulator